MANGIMGNEPYAEWIERDGQAQRLYKAYRDKWPAMRGNRQRVLRALP